MNKGFRIAGLNLAAVVAICGAANTSREPVDIGSRLELFTDRLLVGQLHGAALRLSQPVDRGAVLRFDRPWEGPSAAYCTVIKDAGIYRLYYRGLGEPDAPIPPPGDPDALNGAVTCYAESTDGIHWTKPNLGLYRVNHTFDNNVVYREHDGIYTCHNFSPFLDTRPGVPAAERYKALGGLLMLGDRNLPGIYALVSPDGIHWKRVGDTGVINSTLYHFVNNDTSQSPAFWSEVEGQYVCYLRLREPHSSVPPNKRARMIGRTTSKDFYHWTPVQLMSYGDAPFEQLYVSQLHPYFRAPQIYVGLAARFMLNRHLLTPEQIQETGVSKDHTGEASETVLISTRGGTVIDRTFMEGFVRPDIGPGNWTSRTNYSALNVVPTGPEEMSLYVQRYYEQPRHELHRYTLPVDRFASVNAPYGGGEMITKPLRFTGRRLYVNFATSAAGEILVEMQDAAGRAIPGYSLADSVALIGNEIERVVRWKQTDSVEAASQPVRLRFVMKDADLYALRFH